MPGTPSGQDLPRIGHFIDGSFTTPRGDETVLLTDPYTGHPRARLSSADRSVVDRAVSSARRAFEQSSWKSWSRRDRCDLLMELADAVEADQENLARIEAADTGLPISLVSQGHIPRVIENLRHFASLHHRSHDYVVPHEGGFANLVTELPIGVAAIITPWNSPTSITSISLGACLAAGNTCVLKPSEVAPLSVAAMIVKLAKLGLPPGVVNLVHGGPSTSRRLAEHQGVDVISFTGSQASGAEVAAVASRRIARIALELGGVSSAIVLPDVDVDKAVEGVMWSAFGSNGAACLTTTAIFVHGQVLNDFSQRLADRVDQLEVGDPLNPSTEIGPLPGSAMARLTEQRSLLIGQGFSELCRRRQTAEAANQNRMFVPSLLLAPSSAVDITGVELTGPMSLLSAFSDVDQLVQLLNHGTSGLAASVWGSDSIDTRHVGDSLRFGSVAVNSPVLRDARTPFGGFRGSGLGRVGGEAWPDFWTETRSLTLGLSGPSPHRPV